MTPRARILDAQTKTDQRFREGFREITCFGDVVEEVEKGENHNGFNEIKLRHLLHRLG